MIGHRLSVLLVFAVLALASSCGKQDPPGGTDVVSRLCQHIVQNRQKVIVDTSQPEIVWSDGAMLEFGSNFPAALQKLISEPTQHRDIRSVVAKLQKEKSPEWKSAFVTRTSQADHLATIQSTDGSVTTFIQSLYVEYLHERYPTAGIRIRGRLEPLLFLVDDEVRASVMPVKF